MSLHSGPDRQFSWCNPRQAWNYLGAVVQLADEGNDDALRELPAAAQHYLTAVLEATS